MMMGVFGVVLRMGSLFGTQEAQTLPILPAVQSHSYKADCDQGEMCELSVDVGVGKVS